MEDTAHTLTNVNATIAWAVPVRPDVLGEHLQAYERSLGAITAFRLCSRYGTGEDVHVTKLPAELASYIEDLIFDHHRANASSWQESFCHFEGRCDLMDHVEFGDEYVKAWEKRFDELCDECKANDAEEEECESCRDKICDGMTDVVLDSGDWRQDCEERQSGWEKLIAGEMFNKCQKVNGCCPLR